MILAIVALLVVVFGGALWVGARHQRMEVAARVDRLVRDSAAVGASWPGDDALDSLPAPVARYLRRALPSRPAMRIVRLRQTGSLRTDLDTNRWMRFEAEHTVAPRAVGFVWNARVRVAPLLHVSVRDAFITGEGSGQVSLLSAWPVASDTGTPEMNSGSLHRFLAEAVWYPVALLPSAHLRWTPIDAGKALATLTARDVTVSLEFRFSDAGDVTGIYTPARWGKFGGGYEQRGWEGHFRNYQPRGGAIVPSEGDVGWYAGREWRPVWKGSVTAFSVDGGL